MARRGTPRRTWQIIVFLAALPIVSAVILLALLAISSWRAGDLSMTDQERIDLEFERIVRRLETDAQPG